MPGTSTANWNGRGDVYQINNRLADIIFAPTSSSIKVTLNSFELDEWAGGGNTSALWSVTGSTSGLIASGSWTDKNTANDPNNLGGRTLISPNASGVPGESLTVLFDHSASGGAISYLAMDNLTFSTTVIPEPATAVLDVARRRRPRRNGDSPEAEVKQGNGDWSLVTLPNARHFFPWRCGVAAGRQRGNRRRGPLSRACSLRECHPEG